MLLVVAQSKPAAVSWASVDGGLVEGRDWHYVRDPNELRGWFGPIALVEGWRKREDAEQIEEYVALVRTGRHR